MYQSISHVCADKRVLDIACGMGVGSNILAQKASYVLGIEHSIVLY